MRRATRLRRSGIGVVCAFVAFTGLAISLASPVSAAGDDVGYTSLQPARLLDTRAGSPTIDNAFAGGGALGQGGVVNLTVVGRGNVPTTGVGAVVLNVTATSPTASGFVTVYPTGTQRPNASNLNFVTAQTTPNLVITKVGANGQVALFNSAGNTHLIADVVGWFPSASPTPAVSNVTISAGANHSCALLADTTIKCWGNNFSGQLGDGTNIGSNTPVTVTGLSGATQISAGLYHSCALLADTTVKCWGANFSGQLGNAGNQGSKTPVTVTGLSGATQISIGSYHSCALLANGTIKCWGFNGDGQLGNAVFPMNANTPVTVTGITGATQISAGGNHSCALLADTTIKCWGNNGYGTNIDSNALVTVTGITGATQISAGSAHSCALLADTTIRCWGDNGNGQLGDTTNTPSDTAVTVSGITGATQISAGGFHSCALLADTTIRCWGNNVEGALGDGTNTDSNTPVAVVGGTAGATQISAGGFHSCALLADTTIRCWGNNVEGALGDGTNTDSNTPVAVVGGTAGILV